MARRAALHRAAGTALLALVMVWAGGPATGSPTFSPDERARRLVAVMSVDEKIALVNVRFGMPLSGKPAPPGARGSAGFGLGVPRLGVPPLQETDAGLGIANPTNADFDATAMPSMLALGATFDADLARRAGSVVGGEAHAMGFSVLLGGGADLTRDPRGGRDFEYVGEDPLLTGVISGAAIAGAQGQGIVSTLKHYALNAQENGRVVLDARLAEGAARESDLLAFELALEQGHPGAVMTAYNRVNGTYASQNAHLIDDILKGDWGFGGWVMSDWGGTHSTEAAALAGLDQESGLDLDPTDYFGAPLKAAVATGRVPMARLDDMVLRILRSRIAAGLLDQPPVPGHAGDLEAHAAIEREAATRAIVLLANRDGILPLDRKTRSLLVVGGHADVGVLSGGGSSQVVPKGYVRFEGDPPGAFYGKPKLYDGSPPLVALRRALPRTVVTFHNGHDVAAAAAAAREADAVIVFAEQWRNESRDMPDLSLPNGQDALIAAVAAVNPKTIVVLETGGPVTMPWRDAVAGIVEAWYPGERGGEAIADVLTGRADPSGRLPISFPAREADLPRPRGIDPATTTSNPGEPIKGVPPVVAYDIEGADVGYKWFLREGKVPLYPFGFGLSYTRFAVSRVTARADVASIAVECDVRNVGARAGTAVAQVYLDGLAFTRRLAGFATLTLAPGETRHISFTIDPRLAARWDVAARGWAIAAGRYTAAVRANAQADGPAASLTLAARAWSGRHAP